MLSLLRWIVWGPVAAVLDLMPIGMARSVGKPVGVLAYYIFGGRRRDMLSAMRELLSDYKDSSLEKTARNGFILRCMTEIEYIMFKRLNSESVKKMVTLDGQDRLDKSLENNKGVILATLHFGAHLYPMPALGYSGYEVHQLAGEFDPSMDGEEESASEKKLHKHRLARSEGKLAANIILAGPGRSLRPVFRALKSNELVIMAVDGKRYGTLEGFPFLGSDSFMFSLGCANLAMRSGAPVHPIAVVRQPSGKNVLVICDAVNPSDFSGDAALQEMTSSIVNTLESFVRDNPDHYVMEMLAERRRLHRLELDKTAGSPKDS